MHWPRWGYTWLSFVALILWALWYRYRSVNNTAVTVTIPGYEYMYIFFSRKVISPTKPSSLTAIITAYIMIVIIMIIIIVINNNKIILIDITILRIYLPLFVNFRVIFGYFRYKKPFLSPNTLFNGRSGGDKASFFRRIKLCLDRQQF